VKIIKFEFKTKVQSPTGELLTPYLEEAIEGDSNRVYLKVKEKNEVVEVGFLELSIDSDRCYPGKKSVRLNIESFSHDEPEGKQYKKVGTALLEYTLAISLKNHEGRIMLDAVKDSKAFFEKSKFLVHTAATKAEFGDRLESAREIWSMYLPSENIPLLQARFNAEPVAKKVISYVLLNSTSLEENKKLILSKGGQILSEQNNTLKFTIVSDMLKKDENGGIRDSLKMFRFATIADIVADKKIDALRECLPNVTVEKQSFGDALKYLVTGDERLFFEVDKLMKAKEMSEIVAWKDKVSQSQAILHAQNFQNTQINNANNHSNNTISAANTNVNKGVI